MYLTDSSSKQDFWKLTQATHSCYVWQKVLVKNGTKIPSPRRDFSTWEYSKEIWIFGGIGPPLDGYLNEHGEHEGGDFGYNNQLLKFNPVSKEWSNPRSSGTVPTRKLEHATTATGHKVWLHKTVLFDRLYELDMQSLIWTCIQFNLPRPQMRGLFRLNVLTDSKLVMHGGLGIHIKRILRDAWILDLPSQSWKKYRYTSYKAHPRNSHTGSHGLNNDIIIITGGRSRGLFPKTVAHKEIFHLMFEPKCLQQLAM